MLQIESIAFVTKANRSKLITRSGGTISGIMVRVINNTNICIRHIIAISIKDNLKGEVLIVIRHVTINSLFNFQRTGIVSIGKCIRSFNFVRLVSIGCVFLTQGHIILNTILTIHSANFHIQRRRISNTCNFIRRNLGHSVFVNTNTLNVQVRQIESEATRFNSTANRSSRLIHLATISCCTGNARHRN